MILASTNFNFLPRSGPYGPSKVVKNVKNALIGLYGPKNGQLEADTNRFLFDTGNLIQDKWFKMCMMNISSLEYIPLTCLGVKIWLLWEITMFALHRSKIQKQIDCDISSSHNVKKKILLLFSLNSESVTTIVSEILRF